MKVICAWCGKTVEEGDGLISHGMCADCSRRVSTTLTSGFAAALRRAREQAASRQPGAEPRRSTGRNGGRR